MDASIRINNNVKQIEVNDNGEYISLRLGDADFTNSLVSLMHETKKTADDITAQKLTDSPDDVKALAEQSAVACANIAKRIDEVFGDKVCTKVFGEITPDFDRISEFFTQIAALIKRFQDEEREASRKRIEKYTAKYTKSRGGAR